MAFNMKTVILSVDKRRVMRSLVCPLCGKDVANAYPSVLSHLRKGHKGLCQEEKRSVVEILCPYVVRSIKASLAREEAKRNGK